MSTPDIPIGFVMPSELWMLVDQLTGEPITSDDHPCALLATTSRAYALAIADVLDVSKGIDAVPIKVQFPAVAPTIISSTYAEVTGDRVGITVRAKERPFIPYDDHNEPDYVRAAGLATSAPVSDEELNRGSDA